MSNHTTVGISRFNSVMLPKSRADTAVVESDESMADQTFRPEVSCLNVEVPKTSLRDCGGYFEKAPAYTMRRVLAQESDVCAEKAGSAGSERTKIRFCGAAAIHNQM